MAGPSRLIGDYDLIAYMDDEADAADREEIQAALAADPIRAELVEVWSKNDELLRLACGKAATEPLPVALTLTNKMASAPDAGAAADAPIQAPIRQIRRIEKIRRDQREKLVALTIAAFVAGGLAVLTAAELTEAAPRALALPASYLFPGLTAEVAGERSAQHATAAFRTFASDDARPVEIADEDQMTAWLTRRVGAPIHAPNLTNVGFRLLGGRITPDEHGPAALILYQSSSGNRIGLYISRTSSEDKEFHYSEDHVTGGVWWMERGSFYAVVGRADKVGLMKLAHAMRWQEPMHAHPDLAYPPAD